VGGGVWGGKTCLCFTVYGSEAATDLAEQDRGKPVFSNRYSVIGIPY